jgi:quercetin dioxygenase-like cupin family protein
LGLFLGHKSGLKSVPKAPDFKRAPSHLLWQSGSMSIQVEHWSELTPPDAQELKTRLQSEGYSVFQWSDAPGTKYGPHAHAEDQSHWILSGELEMRVGYETYILGPGDRDFLPANTMHSAFVPGDQPVTYLIGAKH